jgi:hypothetical protein
VLKSVGKGGFEKTKHLKQRVSPINVYHFERYTEGKLVNTRLCFGQTTAYVFRVED